MTAYKPREIAKPLLEALDNMPVVVLSGMRQTGKSTLLLKQPEFKNRKYFTFDDLSVLRAAKEHPENLFESGEPITIDEAQKYPEILNHIKREVDKNRKPGKYIISGSSNFLLLKNCVESLAGRAVYLTLRPFTRRELLGNTHESPAIVHFIQKGSFPARQTSKVRFQEVSTGGMPSVCLGEVKNPAIWFRGYEQTYLERDIRMLTQVADIGGFHTLLQLVALRNAQILKQSELSRESKLNAMTVSRYISLMETSCVLYRVLPHLKNRTSRLVKSAKVYMSDTGLARALSGTGAVEANEMLRGALWENYVVNNLESLLHSYLPDTNITYWNIQGRYEVDIILESGNTTIAIEVKSGSRYDSRDLTGLRAYMNSSKNCIAGILAYNGTELLKLDDKIYAVPIPLLIG